VAVRQASVPTCGVRFFGLRSTAAVSSLG
jgi:hypothetical protein